MKFKILLVFATLLFINCSKKKNISASLLNYIPQDASVLIKINNYQAFKSDLKNNSFLKELEHIEAYNAIVEKTSQLEYLNPTKEGVLAFIEVGKGHYDFVYVTDFETTLLKPEQLKKLTKETLTYESKNYDKYSLEDVSFYSLKQDNKIIICSSQLIIENLMRSIATISPAKTLLKLYEVSNPEKAATAFINITKSDPILNSQLLKKSKLKVSGFSDWVSLDLNANQHQLNLNGITIANDSLNQFINLFKNTNPLSHATPSLAPLNANAVLSFTFDDYNFFAKNQQRYLNRSTPLDTIFNTLEEIGFIYTNAKKAVVLKTYGAENISTYLNSLKKESLEYQGSEINELNSTNFLNEYFKPIVKTFTAKYYTIIDNTFIFSEEIETLQTIISNYKNGATYDKNPIYLTIKEVLAEESSIQLMSNTKGITHLIENDFSAELVKALKKSSLSNYALGAQVVTDQNFYHISIVAQETKKQIKTNTTSPLFTVQLDADLATTPQFTLNHRNNQKEIVVQDVDNNLYLISNKGKVLWKKQLESKIIGKIEQVDIYKNGRLQLAFTTNNQFLILDRNGKEVAPFNKKYESGNLNPLAVFDYEGRKNYRFVVTQGSKIFMYNAKGDIVNGFKYTNANSQILHAPKHFIVGKKDYLCFMLEDNTLKILNRVGKNRVTVKDKFNFSDNEMYLYKNKFTFTDAKGILNQIDGNGKIGRVNFNLNKDHGIAATSKTLVVMNDNTLSIKGKKVELDLGVYSKPIIFYVNDKIYVSVTDIQNQKIHLFDSQAKAIPNFPIYGTSTIDLADIDNDKKIELVSKDLENSIIIYKIN